jgi:tetratricopeptide (TPR) repeat protein
MGVALHLIASLGLLALAGGAWASDESSRLAREALRICDDGSSMKEREAASQHLEHGVEVAEAAVAADERDARAHFALFCNLGKRIEVAGISWRVLGQVARAREEIARATELAPDDADILVAHGELLRRLPSPLGGDRARGLALLERALARRPEHVMGRLYWARALASDGRAEARGAARQALDAAMLAGAIRERDEAQALLTSFRD